MGADDLAVTLHASGSEAISGTGSSVDLESDDVPLRRTMRLVLVVSAITGTLAVSVQHSEDGATWESLATFTSATAVGSEMIWTAECKQHVRAKWTITGGPVTFSLAGAAKQTFCTAANLVALGGAADILTSAVTNEERMRHLASVTTFARGYLSKQGPTPILAVGEDVERAVAQITVVDIITSDTGPHPDEAAMELLLAAADRARAWLRDVSAGKTDADVTFSEEDETSTETGTGYVYGDTQRDWSDALP